MAALAALSDAILLYLRESADIAALVSSRISVDYPTGIDKVVMPPYQNYVMIFVGRGGQGDVGLALQDERVDLRCFGTNALVAYQIWRTLDYYLINPTARVATSFTRANTRVLVPSREGGPLRLSDPSMNNWPFTQGSYRFLYSGIPDS